MVSARTRTIMKAGRIGPTVSGGSTPQLNEDHMDKEMLVATINDQLEREELSPFDNEYKDRLKLHYTLLKDEYFNEMQAAADAATEAGN